MTERVEDLKFLVMISIVTLCGTCLAALAG